RSSHRPEDPGLCPEARDLRPRTRAAHQGVAATDGPEPPALAQRRPPAPGAGAVNRGAGPRRPPAPGAGAVNRGVGQWRPPVWVVPVFAILLLSPPAWATVAVIAVAITAVTFRGIRDVSARRAAAERRGEGTQLGFDRSGRAVVLSDQEVSAHGLIVGASGAGKSTTLLTILTDHVRRGNPVVALDLKGSPLFAERLRCASVAAGRPFRLWSLDGPSVWNPLQHGNATELKDKLIATERFTEPHYQRAAE